LLHPAANRGVRLVSSFRLLARDRGGVAESRGLDVAAGITAERGRFRRTCCAPCHGTAPVSGVREVAARPGSSPIGRGRCRCRCACKHARTAQARHGWRSALRSRARGSRETLRPRQTLSCATQGSPDARVGVDQLTLATPVVGCSCKQVRPAAAAFTILRPSRHRSGRPETPAPHHEVGSDGRLLASSRAIPSGAVALRSVPLSHSGCPSRLGPCPLAVAPTLQHAGAHCADLEASFHD